MHLPPSLSPSLLPSLRLSAGDYFHEPVDRLCCLAAVFTPLDSRPDVALCSSRRSGSSPHPGGQRAGGGPSGLAFSSCFQQERRAPAISVAPASAAISADGGTLPNPPPSSPPLYLPLPIPQAFMGALNLQMWSAEEAWTASQVAREENGGFKKTELD